jgi:DNA-binding response OmpR family regulator
MKTPILLVEDDAKLRRTLAAWISHAGYEVAQAPDGESAIRMLMIESFAVVVSDIVMGGIDGLSVLQAAGRLRQPPAVILLTGQGTLETAMAALRAGAFDYLLKPCNGDELLARIAAAAAHVDAERQLRSALELLTNSTFGAPAPGDVIGGGVARQSGSATLGSLASAVLREAAPPANGRPALPVAVTGQGGAAGTISAALAGVTPSLAMPVLAPPLLPSLPRAAVRPVSERPDQAILLGDLEVGPSRLQVSFEGRPVALTRIEYALLRYLAERPGQVCRYSELAFASHKLALEDGEARDLLRTHLQNLRAKLCRSYFRIDPGTGCMLAAPVVAGARVAV